MKSICGCAGKGFEFCVCPETWADTLRTHNALLAAKNLQMLTLVNQLSGLIDTLATIPAPDFYKPGDHAAGLVCAAWVKKNELRTKAGI